MDTHDVDLTPFENEETAFYAPTKHGEIRRRGHVQAWASGILRGKCVSEPRHADTATFAVDLIHFETDALFETDVSTLSGSGVQRLDALLERIARYGDVHSVSLAGHADRRGSLRYNEALGARRAGSVRDYLELRLDHSIPIKSHTLGERRPRGPELAENRRVEVRVLARGRRDRVRDVSLCSAPKRVALGSASSGAAPAANLTPLAPFDGQPLLSSGDRLRLTVFVDDSFDGLYEIGADGRLDLPLLGAIGAAGLRTDKLEEEITRRLVDAGLLRAHHSRLDLSVVQYAPVNVFVNGAVFAPGRRTINATQTETRSFKQTQRGGDSASERSLANALVAAGGIRPDADLRRIKVRRGGSERIVDLSGVITGEPSVDLPLVDGDVVEVPLSGAFDDRLVRPSQITPPGVRLFISNLTIPADSNSQSAVNSDASSMPYGTRFLHAALSGNCVGGTQYTNAARRAVLVSTNPVTMRTEVIERSIQQLVSDPDRDDINPLLMPNDGVACYDSEVTNLRDVARSVSDVLSPFAILKSLLSY